MSRFPFVSVIVPVLNGEKYVKDCIISLRNQDYPKDKYEIIIVDNGSVDNSVAMLKEVGIGLYIAKKRGRACALNLGIEKAKGEIIAMTDIDCVAEHNWLSKIVEGFTNESIGCVAGEIKLLKTHDNYIVRFQERKHYMSPMYANNPRFPYADGANASFKREVFNKIGLFDESFVKGADVEICYRMQTQTDYKIAFNENAIVWEPGEPTLRALLGQRFRIGIGQFLLRRRYKELFRKKFSIKEKYWQAYNICKKINNYPRLYVKSLRCKEKRFEAYDEFAKLLMLAAETLGRISAPALLRIKRLKNE